MATQKTPNPMFRRVHSFSGLILAVVAVAAPFLALLSHQLDGFVLASLPLSLLAAYMERNAARSRGHVPLAPTPHMLTA